MRRLAVPALLLLAFLAAGAAFHYRQSSMELARQVAEVGRELDDLKKNLEAARSPEPDWKQLGEEMKTGDPAGTLREDLMARKDLIPWKGVLGGTMAIPGPESIWFFAPHWALAYVEDGHIAGYLLFRFRVLGGRIEWTPVEAQSM